MSNTIKLKRGSGSDPGASDLSIGEIAIRTDSGKLFTKKDNGSVAEISGSGGIDDGDKGDITVSNGGDTFTIDSGVVTSAKIANGTIVNADVNASAAIAGTKISPDFGSQNTTTTGTTTTSRVTINSTTPIIEFEESDGNPDYRIVSESGELLFQDADAGPATRLKINTDGHIDVAGNLDVGAGLDVTGNISCSGNVDGRDVASDGSKLDGIESGATADQTASEILTLLKTVDGAGSGLDADTLDGVSSASFLRSDAADTCSQPITFSSGIILPTTGEVIKFGPGTAANDDAHIEWLGGSNAGYLRFSTSDDSDGTGSSEYIEFGDYPTQNRVGTFTQHLRISRDRFLVRTGSNSISQADRLNIDSSGTVDIYGNLDVGAGLDVTGDINCTSDLILDSTNTDHPRITLHSNATGINKYAIINGQAWNPDALLVYDLDGDQSILTVETSGLGIKRGANSISHCLDVGGTAMIRGATEIQGNISLSGNATTTNQNRTISFTGFDKESTNDFTDNAFIRHTTNTGGLGGSVLEIGSLNDSNDGIAFNTNNHNNNLRLNGNKIWNAGNDGSGSGLDADLLDGQEGSYYRNASNLNAGTIPSARVPTLNQNTTGSAATLTTARTIAGVSFDGSANISLNNNAITNGAGYITSSGTSAGFSAGNASNLNSGTIPSGRISDIGNSEAGIITFDNLEKSNLSSDGQVGFDSSQGLLVYRTQQGTTGTVTVLDGANVDAGTGITISNLGTGGTAQESFTFSLGSHSADLLTSGTIPAARLSASDLLTKIKTVDGTGSGLDADTVDGIQASNFVRSDGNDTITGTLTIGDGSGQHELHIKKADNNVSDHLQFYNGTTRMGEIGCEDTTWLRINQETAKNIYTPRYIRADAGFFVDGTSKGINGSGNFIGGTIAGASDYGTLVRSNASDTLTGGTYTFNSSTDQRIILQGATNPYIRFQEGTTNKGYIQWNSAGYLRLVNQEDSSQLRIQDDIKFSQDGSTFYSLWHQGNDGSGSGLDSDTVDGIQGSSLLRSDAADTASGDITFSGGAGAVTVAANSDIRITNGNWTGDSGSVGKIQMHGNRLYVVGGSAGIRFRENGTDRWDIDGSGHFVPRTDSTYNIGSTSIKVANGYFDTLYGDGSNLTGISAGATGGGSDEVFYENGQTVTTSYTITNGKNAMAAGPITINSGVTVTVGSGENLTIV